MLHKWALMVVMGVLLEKMERGPEGPRGGQSSLGSGRRRTTTPFTGTALRTSR